jgi:hypothetical protein
MTDDSSCSLSNVRIFSVEIACWSCMSKAIAVTHLAH